jgi:hypothetical protein
MEDIAAEACDSHGRHRLQLRTGMSNCLFLLFVSRFSSDKEDELTELAKAEGPIRCVYRGECLLFLGLHVEN